MLYGYVVEKTWCSSMFSFRLPADCRSPYPSSHPLRKTARHAGGLEAISADCLPGGLSQSSVGIGRCLACACTCLICGIDFGSKCGYDTCKTGLPRAYYSQMYMTEFHNATHIDQNFVTSTELASALGTFYMQNQAYMLSHEGSTLS